MLDKQMKHHIFDVIVFFVVFILGVLLLSGCTTTRIVEQPVKQQQLILKVDPELLVPPTKLETFE